MSDPIVHQIGVVAIGRNEGVRLRRCLHSVLGRVAAIVYVDSGSSDDSVGMARSLGVEVVELDLGTPFTAARARNAGAARLCEIAPGVDAIQFVDGDCEIAEGWPERAIEAINADVHIAVVCGRRRERFPEASVYNRLCDMEWDTPIGDADACGGDALIRRTAFHKVNGYDPNLIAGEEPEMCFRLRDRGWKVRRIDCEMTLHDAQLLRFGQWWRRSVRSGHAYAEGRAMHGASKERYCVSQVRSIVEWTVLLPVIAAALAWFTWGASLLLLGLYVVLWYRIRSHRLATGNSPADASLYASYCVLGKFAQLHGMIQFAWNRLLGRRSRIIEYKGADSAVAKPSSPGVSKA